MAARARPAVPSRSRRRTGCSRPRGRPLGVGLARAGCTQLAQLAQLPVVAPRIARDQFADLGRLGPPEALEGVGIGEGPEEEIEIEIGRQAEGGTGRRLRVGPEVEGALAAVGDEGIGERAQRILRLRMALAEAQAVPIGRPDVRNAVGGAADVDGRAAIGRQRGGPGLDEHGDAEAQRQRRCRRPDRPKRFSPAHRPAPCPTSRRASRHRAPGTARRGLRAWPA